MPDLRAQIAERMARLGVSQSELARRAKLAQPTISQYLAGRYELTGASLERIAKALSANLTLRDR